METGHPSTWAVNSGSENRAKEALTVDTKRKTAKILDIKNKNNYITRYYYYHIIIKTMQLDLRQYYINNTSDRSSHLISPQAQHQDTT